MRVHVESLKWFQVECGKNLWTEIAIIFWFQKRYLTNVRGTDKGKEEIDFSEITSIILKC